jgi:hypothetical protein
MQLPNIGISTSLIFIVCALAITAAASLAVDRVKRRRAAEAPVPIEGRR